MIPRSIAKTGCGKSRYITIRDDSRPKQNIQSVAKILANSSNIGRGKIGLELGAVKYQRYFSRLGFGERTSVQPPRAAASCARRANGARPTLFPLHSDRASVTVLQMAQAYLTLANEGVYKPLRIVLTDDVGGGDQRIFSKNTTREVLSMMREVVDEGIGSKSRHPRRLRGGQDRYGAEGVSAASMARAHRVVRGGSCPPKNRNIWWSFLLTNRRK